MDAKNKKPIKKSFAKENAMLRHLTVKRFLSLLFAALFLVSCLSLCACASERKALGQDDFLRVENAELVNARGEVVLLQGINLGGWLLQESWMCPVVMKAEHGAKEWGEGDSYNKLLSRGFSEEQIATLFETFRENWITETDIRYIADSGANVIRLPFWYRNFMTNTAGDWITEDFDENPGFKHLDWIIETAGKYGIYIVLDMHGCPGAQSQCNSTGYNGLNELYTDDTCKASMEKLWRAIAARYKGNPVVAAYDIMNEPQNNDDNLSWEKNYYNPWEAKSWTLTNEIYAQMIPAIREEDPDHVISVEGIWRVDNLPNPRDVGWENMLYQLHLYDSTEIFADNVIALKKVTESYGVAGYIGEFFNPDGMALCAKAGLSYSSWTYKGVNHPDNELCFQYYANIEAADLDHDDYETILRKWGAPLRTESFTKNTDLLARFTVAQRSAK